MLFTTEKQIVRFICVGVVGTADIPFFAVCWVAKISLDHKLLCIC